MEKYNYLEAVKNNVLDYIDENIDFLDFDTLDDLIGALNQELIDDDKVTGAKKGSYTFDRWQAEENLCHNLTLLYYAYDAFCVYDALERGAEFCDVLVRQYVLPDAIEQAVKEIEQDFRESHDQYFDVNLQKI